MQNILNFLRKNDIGNPPWDYYFLQNLDEKEYPKYLAKLFKLNTGEKLPLKWDFRNRRRVIDKNKCKTFNQKLQWLKLYGVTPLMRDCTDKIKVRNYVAEKIGEEYLKPILQICNSFDEIDFDKLPNSFLIKINKGSKWQYIIKNKTAFLNNSKLVERVRNQINGWLEQDYSFWCGFELQYFGTNKKILVEELIGNTNIFPIDIEVYCFNSKPKIIKKVYNDIPNKISMYDNNLNNIDFKFLDKEFLVKQNADDIFNQAIDLSIKLSTDFNFVRVDWLIYQNKLYFNELTFTPNSGLVPINKKWNLKMANWIK